MARFTLLALAAASAAALRPRARAAPEDLAVPAGLVESINADASKAWTADASSAARFAGWTRAQVSRILGSRKAPAALKARHDVWDLKELPLTALPASFDVRTAFPGAIAVTSVVRDQSACGSCWAFGSTEGFNDRWAILTNETALLSPADTAFCCKGQSQGCDGGFTEGECSSRDLTDSTFDLAPNRHPYLSALYFSRSSIRRRRQLLHQDGPRHGRQQPLRGLGLIVHVPDLHARPPTHSANL